jgi:type IV secretory pathway VirB2 component (pilin)
MTIAAFFQNLLNLFISIQVPAGTVALVGGGVAAAFRLIHWHTLFEILGGLAIAFAAANIVSTVYG